MKKALIIFFSLVLVFNLSTVVLAQGDEHPGDNIQDRLEDLREKRDENKQRRQDRLEELRRDVREKVATRQAQAKTRVLEKIKEIFGKIINRYNAALARLDTISERIASRIDKLNEKGVDTSEAEAKLFEAEEAGFAAQGLIEDAKASVDAIDTSSDSVRDFVQVAKGAVRSAKKGLFDYHKALVETIRLLKASSDLRGNE
jgi:DNA repair exonuclease SbcCD ATPase subunit